MPIPNRIHDLLVCPRCHGPLQDAHESLRCSHCGTITRVKNAVPIFSEYTGEADADLLFQQESMAEKTLLARLQKLGMKVINSDYTPQNHLADFLRQRKGKGCLVELGSGNRRLVDEIINVDLFPFPNVDIAADIAATPFADNSVDTLVLDTVLEHVPEPHVVVDEIFRILSPGGEVLCIVPWLFPYHGYPKNYFNISADGLAFLFRHFSSCRIETNIGPSSALTNILSEYVALGLSAKRGTWYSIAKGVALLPIFYLKYLDKLWSRSAKSQRIASHISAFVVK